MHLPCSVGLFVICCLLSFNSQSHTTNDKERQLLTDLKYLSSPLLGGRKPDTPGHALAQRYLEKRFKQIGLSYFGESYRRSFEREQRFSAMLGHNVVGIKYGAVDATKFIVITAHYDHLGLSKGKMHLGADDNASGVAGLLNLASTLMPLDTRYSYIFVATDLEERGLYGSLMFVKHPPVPISSIVLNINLDMISRGDKCRCLYVAGTRKNARFKQVLNDVAERQRTNSFQLKRGHDKKHFRTVSYQSSDVDWYRASDHYAFAKKRIPFLYFGVDTHEDYHRSTDTFENITPSFFLSANQAIVDFVLTLDRVGIATTSH